MVLKTRVSKQSLGDMKKGLCIGSTLTHSDSYLNWRVRGGGGMGGGVKGAKGQERKGGEGGFPRRKGLSFLWGISAFFAFGRPFFSSFPRGILPFLGSLLGYCRLLLGGGRLVTSWLFFSYWGS